LANSDVKIRHGRRILTRIREGGIKLKGFIILWAVILSALIALAGCGERGTRGRRGMSEEKKAEREAAGRLFIMGRAFQDDTYPEIQGEERSRQAKLYAALAWKDIEEVQVCLDGGANPDICLSGEGWEQNNPLSVIIRRMYLEYTDVKRGDEVPDPMPDIAIMRLLQKAGADFNRRPFVWETVWTFDKEETDLILRKPEQSYLGVPFATPEEAAEEAAYYVNDANRLVLGLIEGGADPDKRGHPYPYNSDIEDMFMSEEEADTYFARGTRPLNEAIKKGMVWERQVDLLLRYVRLDEASLEAARESGDPAMVEKITKLWNEP
jgi:hypothetical protein